MALGRGWGVTCAVPSWHPAYRRRERGSGFDEEQENLSFDAKGAAQVEDTTSARVPMRGTGAEVFVVGQKVL